MIFEELELELTSKCNAACPLCPREVPYIKTELDKVINEITLEKIKTWLPLEFVTNIKKIAFKGVFSEPVIAHDFYEIVEFFVLNSNAEISIHTNGSLRKPDFWQRLGKLLCNRGQVIFGIDGLTDTHSIYRVNTNYEKIIENACSFINAGGYAIWQFIVFKHNEHQIELAKNLAKEIGFSEFLTIGSSRFDSSETIILNKKNQEIQKNVTYSSGTMNDIQKNGNLDKSIKCKSYQKKWIAIDWDGEVFPCCFGIGWKKNFSHVGIKLDTQKWYKMILPDKNFMNLQHNSIENILEFLTLFYQNLSKKYLLKTCTIYCGLHNNNYENYNSKLLKS